MYGATDMAEDDIYSIMSRKDLLAPKYNAEDLSRATATGRPLPKFEQDWATNAMVDGFGSGTANMLPHRFTDDSMLTIPIPAKDLEEAMSTQETAGPVYHEEQKKSSARSWFRRKSSAQKERMGGKGGITMVKMTRGEYLRFWAKGEDGRYLEGVVAPAEGRREWVRRKMEGQ